MLKVLQTICVIYVWLYITWCIFTVVALKIFDFTWPVHVITCSGVILVLALMILYAIQVTF